MLCQRQRRLVAAPAASASRRRCSFNPSFGQSVGPGSVLCASHDDIVESNGDAVWCNMRRCTLHPRRDRSREIVFG